MKSGKLLIPALVATSAMTLFSYLISESKNKNFREPDVLKQLIKRLPSGTSKDNADLAGWITHYGIGLIFELFFIEFWEKYKIKPSIASGSVLGAVSGIVGIAAWQVMFKIHPNPPAKNLKKYLSHLILAHLVFGFSSGIVNNLTPVDKKVFEE